MTSVLEFFHLSRASGGRLTLTFLSFEAEWPAARSGDFARLAGEVNRTANWVNWL